jgi:hypothetical protein
VNTSRCCAAFGQDQTIVRTAVIALLALAVEPSLTAVNDLPATVATLARGAGSPIDVDVRGPGGFALEDHWTTTDVVLAIAGGRYDFVVLQQAPSAPRPRPWEAGRRGC